MGTPTVVEAGEYSTEELIDLLESGERVVVETEFLGSVHEVTLRWDGATYYCDTPTRLHRHDDVEEMRFCIRKNGYASDA